MRHDSVSNTEWDNEISVLQAKSETVDKDKEKSNMIRYIYKIREIYQCNSTFLWTVFLPWCNSLTRRFFQLPGVNAKCRLTFSHATSRPGGVSRRLFTSLLFPECSTWLVCFVRTYIQIKRSLYYCCLLFLVRFLLEVFHKIIYLCILFLYLHISMLKISLSLLVIASKLHITTRTSTTRANNKQQ